jgi:endonuclease/exonuclease/phosphatase family metal-dependent hydrolase
MLCQSRVRSTWRLLPCTVLANRPVELVPAYLLPARPLIQSDLTECLSGGFPVLLAGDLNAKHTDWNSRLTSTTGLTLSDYANRNSLIYGPDFPTAVPHLPNATPDALDIVVAKDSVPPVHPTVRSALSSHHLPTLIDTTCRTSFQNPLDHSDFERMDWDSQP